MEPMTELNDRSLTVLLTASTQKKLKVLAKKNGRSLSGEARFALSQYATKGKV